MFEREQMQALINTTVDGIISISADGRIQLFNAASEKLFGWKSEEVLGRNVSTLMPSHYADHHDRYLQNYLDSGIARIIGVGRQVQGQRKDGTIFPMDLSVGEFQAGGQRYFVGIVRDLTASIAENERLKTLQRQLEQSDRYSALKEIGAALAHELNQPLTAIDLFLVAAERSLDSDTARARELFTRVRQEATRAGSIIKRIREMAEQHDSDPSLFRPQQAIQSAVDLCLSTESRKVELAITPFEDTDLLGDETQLRMILVNLIKNALDATSGQTERRIEIRVRPDDPFTVDVVDNGPGVPDSLAPQLFEPFTSTKSHGLGIGLSICRTMAEHSHGNLYYLPPAEQTRSLGGACFRLELPRRRA